LGTHSEQNPWNLAHARKSPDWLWWREAVAEEYGSLLQHSNVWELVDKPYGANAVGCRWILAKKYDADGNLTKYKARLCAQGYSQIEGIGYPCTFSPVVSSSSPRTVLAIKASEDMEVHCMDITKAFSP
ncbi:unnamed protein product, partial [Heterosigma akashiwo]